MTENTSKGKNKKEKKNTPKPQLNLEFKIYNSEGSLFNYKVKETVDIKHSTNESFYYYMPKNRKQIINSKDHRNIQPNCDILFRARKSENGYYELISPIHFIDILKLNNLENLEQKMWYVLPSEEGQCKFENKNAQINLKQGDIIKLGQKMYQIVKKNIIGQKEEETNNYLDNIFSEQVDDKKIIITHEDVVDKGNEGDKGKKDGKDDKDKKDDESKKDDKDDKDDKENKENNENKENKKRKNEDEHNPETDCRICFEYESTTSNPKLQICKCKNSLIHLNCLKEQLKPKDIKGNKKNTVTSYKWEKFNCEVCRAPYPYKFKNSKGNVTYTLVDIELPEETNYIILESLPFIQDNKNIKNIHVVKLTGSDGISIGRNEKNDIIDIDNTVSRSHGKLRFNSETGEVNLINQGTFGISVLIKNNLKIEIGQTKYIQVGKTYIKAEVVEDKNDKKDNNLEQKESMMDNENENNNNNISANSNITVDKTERINSDNINTHNINL